MYEMVVVILQLVCGPLKVEKSADSIFLRFNYFCCIAHVSNDRNDSPADLLPSTSTKKAYLRFYCDFLISSMKHVRNCRNDIPACLLPSGGKKKTHLRFSCDLNFLLYIHVRVFAILQICVCNSDVDLRVYFCVCMHLVFANIFVLENLHN